MHAAPEDTLTSVPSSIHKKDNQIYWPVLVQFLVMDLNDLNTVIHALKIF